MQETDAILLLGPTGSGKTPLGELLAARGLWGRRCLHFDFGEQLRKIAAGHNWPGLSADDVDFVVQVVETGALLENEDFHIADVILRGFIDERNIGPGDWVVLNGLPRHVDQAEDVDTIVCVRAVIDLRCGPDVVSERIRTNAGGDRAARTDDDPKAVTKKLEIYTRRISPVVEHYRARRARIETVNVAVDSTAESILQVLEGRSQRS